MRGSPGIPIELAADVASYEGLQYIATLNTDDLEKQLGASWC
jgi:hypothetical protein